MFGLKKLKRDVAECERRLDGLAQKNRCDRGDHKKEDWTVSAYADPPFISCKYCGRTPEKSK